MPREPKKQKTFRLSDSVIAMVQREAVERDVSQNNLVDKILREALTRDESEESQSA